MAKLDEMKINGQSLCTQQELYWRIFEKSGSLDAYLGYSCSKKGNAN